MLLFFYYAMKPTFTIGVFGIIRDEQDRVLLCLRNDYDLRNLPGGTLEYGESPRQWVIREVKEETGLEVEIERFAWVYSKVEKNDIAFSFECRIVGWAITLNEEAKDIQYFSFNDIPKNTSPHQVERIKDVLDSITDKVIMKVQKGKSSIELIKEGKL